MCNHTSAFRNTQHLRKHLHFCTTIFDVCPVTINNCKAAAAAHTCNLQVSDIAIAQDALIVSHLMIKPSQAGSGQWHTSIHDNRTRRALKPWSSCLCSCLVMVLSTLVCTRHITRKLLLQRIKAWCQLQPQGRARRGGAKMCNCKLPEIFQTLRLR